MPKQVSGILTGNIRVFSKFFLCACFEVKTITSTTEHNSNWISMRTDHSIIHSHSRFIKKDSQYKQECKSNPKPVDNSNHPHQLQTILKGQKLFLLENRAVQPLQTYKCRDSTAGHWHQNTPPHSLLLRAGKLIKCHLSVTDITNSWSIWERENFTEDLTKPNPVLFEDHYMRWYSCNHMRNSKLFRISTSMLKKRWICVYLNTILFEFPILLLRIHCFHKKSCLQWWGQGISLLFWLIMGLILHPL